MSGTSDELIAALRAAAALAPTNVELRLHVIRALVAAGRPEDAEEEGRAALAQIADAPRLRLGLAEAFAAQGRTAEALVTIESVPEPERDGDANLLLARLHLATGDRPEAAAAYRIALEGDAGLRDAELDAELALDGPIEEDETDVPDEMVLVPTTGPTIEDLDDVIAPIERPDVGFEDVGGLEEVKDEIRMKIIAPISHPELFAAYGARAGGGVLLFGPPGCGKTYLARATAGEINAAFINVGIDDVLDPYLGLSERQLAGIFAQARRHAPCVLFFDEVDALAADRRDLRGSAGRTLINQFLAEMDGPASDNDGVLILAATNGPWYLDPAFRRPGRFDRQVFVPPPDRDAREAILKILLTDRPGGGDVDARKVADAAKDFSGADLRATVERATEGKLREALRSGRPEPLTTNDLVSAAKRTRPSTGEWFASARNYVLHANQSGVYDEIARYLGLGG